MKFNKVKLKKKAKENAPAMLIGFGIVGMAVSTISAVKATPKVHAMLEKEKEIRHLECREELTNKEIIKMCWKSYVPTAIYFSLSTAAILGAHKLDTKQCAVLASACTLSERAFTEYRDKVVEVIGEEKEREVRDAISKDRVKNETGSVVIMGEGDALCYDTISGRYFKSNSNHIQKIENFLNRRLIEVSYCSLNEVYGELGLDYVEMGDVLGWNIDDGDIAIYLSTQLTPDNKPCLVLNYTVQPKYDYDRFS